MEEIEPWHNEHDWVNKSGGKKIFVLLHFKFR